MRDGKGWGGGGGRWMRLKGDSPQMESGASRWALFDGVSAQAYTCPSHTPHTHTHHGIPFAAAPLLGARKGCTHPLSHR